MTNVMATPTPSRATTKVCPVCRETRPWTAFGISRRDGQSATCKPCRAARMRQWRKANPDLVRLDNHTRYRRNPAIYKAKVAVRRAVLRGTLTKPHRCRCGQTPVEAHHYRGYHKTHWLTVQWLCRSCHTLVHHTPTQ